MSHGRQNLSSSRDSAFRSVIYREIVFTTIKDNDSDGHDCCTLHFMFVGKFMYSHYHSVTISDCESIIYSCLYLIDSYHVE